MVGKVTTNHVSAPINRNDLDGEGLLNVWEANEMGINNDGMTDPDLPFQKTNPLHKDTYVQIDCMELHRPNSDAIDKQSLISSNLFKFTKFPISSIVMNYGY